MLGDSEQKQILKSMLRSKNGRIIVSVRNVHSMDTMHTCRDISISMCTLGSVCPSDNVGPTSEMKAYINGAWDERKRLAQPT